jgi:hypothetical protein
MGINKPHFPTGTAVLFTPSEVTTSLQGIPHSVEGQPGNVARGLLEEEMKANRHRTIIAASPNSRRQDGTQREIRNFLRALSSYPERFADNPCLSFEQHLFSIALTSSVAGQGTRQN